MTPEALSGARIYLKREDGLPPGAHKISNTVGQALPAVRMGKRRIIAEPGAGQHEVATAAVTAAFGPPRDIYMGTDDMERQALNVFGIRLLGARVTPRTAAAVEHAVRICLDLRPRLCTRRNVQQHVSRYRHRRGRR